MTSPVGSKTMAASAAPLPSALSAAAVLCWASTSSAVRRSRSGLVLPLECRELRVQLIREAVQLRLEPVLQLAEALATRAAATLRLFVELLEQAGARILVDPRHDVLREVQDALEVAGADVEKDAEPARRALEVPDVRDGARQLDVAHPLATHLGARHLDAALVADDALVADALVLAAVALPVSGGPEDALVEEPILLGPQRAVVDRLRLRHLTLGPVTNLVRGR